MVSLSRPSDGLLNCMRCSLWELGSVIIVMLTTFARFYIAPMK
jgi:hypothetical protein